MRTVARRIARRLRPQRVEPLPSQIFGVFERDGRATLELLDGYRDVLKPTWRLAWWATRVLLDVRAAEALPADCERLAKSLLAARTLPVPLRDYASAASRLAEERPETVARTGRVDRRLGVEIVERPAEPAQLEKTAAYYRDAAQETSGVLAALGVRLGEARILEIGCGTGFMTFALAGAGAREAVGTDLRLEGYVPAADREWMREALTGRSGNALLQEADAAQPPFEDGAFDAVVSNSALEHMHDLEAVLTETRRVLRPGGSAVHAVHPWFAPNGGHALCSLDAPWAHVRLDEAELERYLRTWRPNESDDAIRAFREDFQSPRLTIAETRALFERCGYEIVRFTPGGHDRRHAATLSRDVLADCRETWPAVTRDDLLTPGYTVVARRNS